MQTVVLLRHGESVWNRDNRFTGWNDVDLTARGVAEARAAGRLLREGGYRFDVAYTSLLKRAIRTLWLVLDELDLMWIPVHRSWRLNERHYGALQGLNKAETVREYGAEQVHRWRRSYAVRPPALAPEDPRHPRHDARYRGLQPEDLPATESLRDTVERLLPFAQGTLVPVLQEGRRVLIVAHGNTLRALIKHADRVPDVEIAELNIPTGVPLVYELGDDLTPLRHFYLGDPEAAARAAREVAEQAGAAGTRGTEATA